MKKFNLEKFRNEGIMKGEKQQFRDIYGNSKGKIIYPIFRFSPFFVVILKKEMRMEFNPELNIF
jgi:hypothetical protein